MWRLVLKRQWVLFLAALALVLSACADGTATNENIGGVDTGTGMIDTQSTDSASDVGTDTNAGTDTNVHGEILEKIIA